jgi:hypothetical protein
LTAIRHPKLALTSRVIAAIVLGYAATVGVVTLFTVLLTVVFGIARNESLALTIMIGFVAYAAVMLWGFAEARVWRVWAVLGSVAILSHVAAIALARTLPPIPMIGS